MPGVFPRLSEALADRYALDRELGQGGMATVYLAEDLRHHRKVALKVLRPELAAVLGAERFLKEIETTASLHHPHILPLFDSGEVDGGPGASAPFLYYVMPYIEGESLRCRLNREKQLPIADATRIATEIAGALDYAHRSGILHRDIKPENILLHDGRALVADFGIAIAMRNAGGTRLTETGLSLGTPQYMSPEQATAERDLDVRTDIYALGAVTYEMLTGEPPFMGTTAQAVIAKLMTEAARPPSVLRKAVPPAVEGAVLTALEKVPADRWASAAEFAAALAGDGRPGDRGGGSLRSPSLPRRAPGSRLTVALVAVTVVASAFALRGSLAGGRARPAKAIPTRVMIPLGLDLILAQDVLPFDISADGSEIVYAGESGGQAELFLRPLGSFEGRAIPGTEGASQPFLSPDGKWIGFFADGKLQKVSRDGGAPIALAEVPQGWDGASWGTDGTILYALRGPALYRISDGGGRPVTIPIVPAPAPSTRDSQPPAPPITAVRWPSQLPDGTHALVTTNTGLVAVVTLATGELKPLLRGSKARYLPTGHLIFDEDEGRIRVVPFDLRRLAVTGGPVPAFEAFRGPGGGAARFAVSQTGTLVYVAGGFNRSLVLVDRDGRETPVAVPARGYRFPRFSPDGRLVNVTIDPRPSSLWVVDLRRGQSVRVTTELHNLNAVWAPDGERLAFYRGGALWWVRWRSGDSLAPVLVTASKGPELYPTDWARDGRILASRTGPTERDIVTVTIGDSVARPLHATPAVEAQGKVSRDGRWLCFRSNVTGSDEVYVRPYPSGGTSTLVSTHGGTDPRWSPDGKELYYREGTRIMAVPVRTGPAFEALGPPRLLFAGAYDFSQMDNWDAGPDGRFIMVRGDPASRGQFLVVLNWFAELEQAGGGR
jgi:eukaryotic-like serine/threonine-protein kinase